MASSHGRWTPEEDAALRKHADQGPSWEGWARLLDGRTKDSICKRRKKLGLVSVSRSEGISRGWESRRAKAATKPTARAEAKPAPKPEADPSPKPKVEDAVVVAGQSEWTPKQDEALLKGAVALTEACDHNWQECAMRVCELVATTRAGKEGS